MALTDMIPASWSAQVFTYLNFGLEVVLALIVVGVIGFGVYYMMLYKHQVFVLQKIGTTYQLILRKGRIKRSMGNTEMFLSVPGSKGEKILPPRDDQWFPFKGGRKALLLRQEGNSYTPLMVDDSQPDKMRYDEYDVKTFYLAESKRMIDKYRKQNFMDKYGGIIAFGALIILMFLVFMMFFQRMDTLIAAMDSVMKTAIASLHSPAPPGA